MDLMAADMFAQVTAAQAEMEAMKAENRLREICGESPSYGYDHFMEIVVRMEGISQSIDRCFRQ